MEKRFASVLAATAIALAASPASAQDIANRCEQAKEQLVTGYDRLEPERNALNYEIWISDACREYRRSRELNLDSELQRVEELLRGRGGRYDDLLGNMRPDCERQVARRWAAQSETFRASRREQELLATCLHNAKNAARLQALHELNIGAAEETVRLQRERLDKIATDRRRHAEAMEAWEVAVERCRAGEIGYCAN